MGKDLAESFPVARQVFEEADDALGFAISRLCFEGPAEELQLTENTQPAILTVSVAAFRMMQEAGIGAPAFVAGHSLGEYSALVAAGALNFRMRFGRCARAAATCRKLFQSARARWRRY